MAYDLTILEEGCQELGITLDEVQKKQFTDFYEYLVEKNKVMNLTGITEFQEVLVKHFLVFRAFRSRSRSRIWKPAFWILSKKE